MKFKFKRIVYYLFFFTSLLLSDCTNDLDYSPIPAIKFKEYEVIKNIQGIDSAIKLTISYVDGDGDLGLGQGDTLPPFDSMYYYNMIINYYEKIDGEFREVERNPITKDTVRYKYRFPVLTPNSNYKTIKGEIECSINDLRYLTSISNPIKFRIYIIDRSLQESNKEWSEEFEFNP